MQALNIPAEYFISFQSSDWIPQMYNTDFFFYLNVTSAFKELKNLIQVNLFY